MIARGGVYALDLTLKNVSNMLQRYRIPTVMLVSDSGNAVYVVDSHAPLAPGMKVTVTVRLEASAVGSVSDLKVEIRTEHDTFYVPVLANVVDPDDFDAAKRSRAVRECGRVSAEDDNPATGADEVKEDGRGAVEA